MSHVTCRLTANNSALHPSGVAKSSTSFGWGKGGNVISAGWQVTPSDPVWHVSSRSGEACCELVYSVYLFFTFYLYKRRGGRYLPVEVLLSLFLLDFECEPGAEDALQQQARPSVPPKRVHISFLTSRPNIY